MNQRTFGSSIWLLAVVAVMVLFIGAFTRFDTSHGESNAAPIPMEAAIVDAPPVDSLRAPQPAVAPVMPANLSPGLADVIKLAQSHIPEETILAFVQTSGQTYKPTADEILYLYDLGLSDKVVGAMVKKPDSTAIAATPEIPAAPSNAVPVEIPPATGEPVPASALAAMPDGLMNPPAAPLEEAPPLQNPQDSYFFDSLSPYGSWVQLDDGTWAWQPMVSSVSTDWTPYRDRGHWALTDEGWYWASDYSWGWAAFHYGRWSRQNRYGWVWHPGRVWAPAWVAWRNSEDYAGWAPLPPGVVFQPNLGLMAGPGLAGFDVSFGVSPAWFTFVSYNNFQSRRLTAFAVPASRTTALFRSTTPVNNYSSAGHRVLNLGVAPERVAAATKMPVSKYTLSETSTPDSVGARPRDRNLAVFRPDLSSASTPPAAPISKTARTSDSENSMARSFMPKSAAPNPDETGVAGRPAWAASPTRPGFTTSNFRPSPRTSPSAVDEASGAARMISQAGETRRNLQPAEAGSGNPMAGAAANSARAYNSAASTAPVYSTPSRTAPTYTAPQRNEPAYAPAQRSEPAYAPAQPAPSQSHGGGSTSTSSSSSSKSGNKN